MFYGTWKAFIRKLHDCLGFRCFSCSSYNIWFIYSKCSMVPFLCSVDHEILRCVPVHARIHETELVACFLLNCFIYKSVLPYFFFIYFCFNLTALPSGGKSALSGLQSSIDDPRGDGFLSARAFSIFSSLSLISICNGSEWHDLISTQKFDRVPKTYQIADTYLTEFVYIILFLRLIKYYFTYYFSSHFLKYFWLRISVPTVVWWVIANYECVSEP